MAQRTCILKVNIKCCNGCQKTARKKLQKVPGVNSIFYDSQDGFMMVAGDMDPMELVDQFTKWGKKAELVSVQNVSSTIQDIKTSPEESPMRHDINAQDNKTCQSLLFDHNPNTNDVSVKNPDEKKKRRTCFLLSLFGRNKREPKGKPKVEPLRERQPCIWPENARVLPKPNAPPLQPPTPPQYASVFSHMGPQPSSVYGCSGIFQPRPTPLPQTSPMVHFSSHLDNPW